MQRNKRLLQTAGIFVALVIAVLGVRVATGDDDAPDSFFIETGPRIVDEITAQSNLSTKEAITAQMEADRSATEQAWLSGPQLKGAPNSQLPNVPDPPFPTGIFPDAGSIPSGWGSLYWIENRWQGSFNPNNYIARAGLKYDGSEPETINNPAQGVLVLTIIPLGDFDPYSETYTTPTRSGSTHVTAENGACLTLTSTGNITYQFNVVTHQWSCNVNQQLDWSTDMRRYPAR